jgi:cyanate lyase
VKRLDKHKLKAAMKGDKFNALESILGVKRVAISRRLNGHMDFELSEIQKIAKHYDFSEQQINEIFFAT